jgi:PrgI family protein
MQFHVPQNIAMEDRIVGPLTVIQFSILVVGGLGSFMLFSSQSIPTYIGQPLGLLGGLITVTLSFGKFNDQPMYRFSKFIIAYMVNPKVRVWHKKGHDQVLIKRVDHSHDNEPKLHGKRVSKEEIARIANALDNRGSSSNPLIAKR